MKRRRCNAPISKSLLKPFSVFGHEFAILPDAHCPKLAKPGKRRCALHAKKKRVRVRVDRERLARRRARARHQRQARARAHEILRERMKAARKERSS